ncbi:hypothetical protein [Kiloniella sp. b19]|uniref:hypothetical protein n=1 Tax=Kiloniella sp. GXU_MW_B19 TaxID=3141326 RepID=UPI0031CE4340
MAREVSYEVDSYQNNRWILESVFDDREMAIATAERLFATKRFSAVRVLQESYNPETMESVERVVHKCSNVEKSNADAQKRDLKNKREALSQRSERRPLRKRPAPPPKKEMSLFTLLVVTIVVMIAVGVAGIFGMSYM